MQGVWEFVSAQSEIGSNTDAESRKLVRKTAMRAFDHPKRWRDFKNSPRNRKGKRTRQVAHPVSHLQAPIRLN
jgi:hypothetical protein